MNDYPNPADLEESQRYVDCDIDGSPVVVTWEKVSRAYYGTVVCVWINGTHFDAENFSRIALKELTDQCVRDDERQEVAA